MLRIYKIGGGEGGRGSDCWRVEVHQGHRNPTHDKQVDDTNYSIDQLTNAWLSKNCGNKSVWCFARFGFGHVIHSWGRVAAVTLITCFSGSNVDWRVYRNVTSPLFLARKRKPAFWNRRPWDVLSFQIIKLVVLSTDIMFSKLPPFCVGI